jgi:hypothetical protein
VVVAGHDMMVPMTLLTVVVDDEAAERLRRRAEREGVTIHYTYDFGDDWRHKITVEKVSPAGLGTTVPACIGGRRACPPEDCGGPWGYQDLLESIAGGPASGDDRLDFVGHDFDPGAFDLGDFALNLANVHNTCFDT